MPSTYSLFLSPVDFGATGDAKILKDVTMISGSTTLSDPNASFTNTDVGRIICVYHAGAAGSEGFGGPLVTTIASVTSATQVQLTAAAITSVAPSGDTSDRAEEIQYIKASWAHYGTDDTDAINATIAAAVNAGIGEIVIPSGKYLITSPLANVRNHLIFRGEGMGRSMLLAGSASMRAIFELTGGNFNYVQLRDLTLRGCGQWNNEVMGVNGHDMAAGTAADTSEGPSFYNLMLEHFGGSGIYFGGFYGGVYTRITNDNDHWVNDVFNSRLETVLARYCGRSAIRMDHSGPSNQFSNCYLRYPHGVGDIDMNTNVGATTVPGAWVEGKRYRSAKSTPVNGSIPAANLYAVPAVDTLATGNVYSVLPDFTNTGSASLQHGSNTKALKTTAGANLAAGAITQGQPFIACYDGTNFVLVNATIATELATGAKEVVSAQQYSIDLGTGDAHILNLSPTNGGTPNDSGMPAYYRGGLVRANCSNLLITELDAEAYSGTGVLLGDYVKSALVNKANFAGFDGNVAIVARNNTFGQTGSGERMGVLLIGIDYNEYNTYDEKHAVHGTGVFAFGPTMSYTGAGPTSGFLGDRVFDPVSRRSVIITTLRSYGSLLSDSTGQYYSPMVIGAAHLPATMMNAVGIRTMRELPHEGYIDLTDANWKKGDEVWVGASSLADGTYARWKCVASKADNGGSAAKFVGMDPFPGYVGGYDGAFPAVNVDRYHTIFAYMRQGGFTVTNPGYGSIPPWDGQKFWIKLIGGDATAGTLAFGTAFNLNGFAPPPVPQNRHHHYTFQYSTANNKWNLVDVHAL